MKPKPTQADLFSKFDEYSELAKKKIRQEFNRVQLAPFDELNVIRASQLTETIWNRVDKFNRKHYADLCMWVYEYVYVMYGKNLPEKDWDRIVDDWLRGYDPVTRYIYTRELDRKRLRMNEGIQACRETQDRPGLTEVVREAAGLLLTQSLQYGLDLMGECQRTALEEVVEDAEVIYHACNDSRTCGECKDDDGKIFPISAAPRLPRHYRCRCWYTRA